LQPSPSFAEIAVWEAVARRARVDLVIKPVTPHTETRLLSRFLGKPGDDQVALEVPRDRRGTKVFVPAGWEVGMAFEVGGLWLQARAEVVGHCQFAALPGMRVDALLIRPPQRILSLNRRRSPRYVADPTRPVWATVWAAERIDSGRGGSGRGGRLVDFSGGGLGIRLAAPPPLDVGGAAYIRLQALDADECPIYLGVLKHATPGDDGSWRVGFGEVEPVRPGEAASLRVVAALQNAVANDEGASEGEAP
jgi:hypothetical protein